MKITDKILVIDLEATCWKSNESRGQTSEIIEIGICVLNTKDGSISQNKGIMVKPKHSTISSFCTELTTITQGLIDEQGISLSDACKLLREEYDAYSYTWASYGGYDLKMMKSECLHKGVDYPLCQDHINVKELFTEAREINKKVGMNGALQILGLPLEGTHHRGVDDAKNIAKILYWCITNMKNEQ